MAQPSVGGDPLHLRNDSCLGGDPPHPVMHRPRLAFSATVFVLLCATAGAADRGRLIYTDGNQITGTLLADHMFASDRFGMVRFDSSEAHFVVDKPERPPDPDQKVPAAAPSTEQLAPSISPAKPSKAWWHPWSFAINGFVDSTKENGERRREYHGSFRIERPIGTGGRLLLESSYEYRTAETRLDQRRATTQGEYRHRFDNSRWFALYQPKFEYDGRNLNATQAEQYGRARINYLISQHAFGCGYILLDRPRLKSNAVLGWNHLDIEVYDLGSYTTGMPSFDLEHHLTLGGGYEFKQQGRIYWLQHRGSFAWENRIELSKRLAEHLLLTLRHEYRQNYPLRDANPLDRLRLLFGLEY